MCKSLLLGAVWWDSTGKKEKGGTTQPYGFVNQC
jgi:hypothetical protein